MQNESQSYPEQDNEESHPAAQPDLHAEEDGRNREWEDRARVNMEDVPEGAHTTIERDFEAEPDNDKNKKNPNDNTAY